MRTACIVQARLRSTRLPGKVLLPLPTGRTVLEEVLYRCRQIDGVDVVVAAIADDEGSDLLGGLLANSSWPPVILLPSEEELEFRPGGSMIARSRDLAPLEIVRGPEHDVLARYLKAAEAVNAEVILRVTSDCPLIEPEVCAHVLKVRAKADADYAANNLVPGNPHGLDCEAFTIDTLRRAYMACALREHEDGPELYDLSRAAEWREHVTGWMRTSDGVSRASAHAIEDRSHIRWTLDAIKDYVIICNEIKRRMSEMVAA